MTEGINEKIKEVAVIAGASLGKGTLDDTDEYSLNELCELAKTAGAEVAGVMMQNVKAYDPRTYIGSGKVQELREFIENNGVTVAVFDDELSGSVTRNLESELGVKVIDRSRLILDIFAGRATSREGKCQVELAQLRYLLPRLSGIGSDLSRLGGGIGTRGPGETKLESDRRHVRRRIEHLQTELKEIEKHRENIRKKRRKEEIPVVALVGYTNAGKSSLMNALTEADTYVENQLFATLDPLMRRMQVSDTLEIVLSDTVGFIRKLPHHLVEAFKSTLEETLYADLILHVVDGAGTEIESQMKVVNQILNDLGAQDKPMITVFNKCDIASAPLVRCEGDTISVSAKTGENLPLLLDKIDQKLSGSKVLVSLLIPYSEGKLLGFLYQNGTVMSEENVAEGTKIRVVLEEEHLHRVREFMEQAL